MAARRRRKVTWPIVNKDDIPLRNVIEEYLQYHDGLNHSPKTVRWGSVRSQGSSTIVACWRARSRPTPNLRVGVVRPRSGPSRRQSPEF